MKRLNVIDGMRGHLLLGMMIAHLNFQSVNFFEYLHPYFYIGIYDAEFFVLISGLLLGIVTSGRSKGRSDLAFFCIKRIRLIYLYYVLCNVPYFALELWRGTTFNELPARLIASFFLLDGGLLAGVLYIYIFCFAYLLLFASIFANRWLIASASAALYVIGLIDGRTGLFGYGQDITYFNLQTWQFIFILGFLAGEKRSEIAAFLHQLGARAIQSFTVGVIMFVLGSHLSAWYPDIGYVPGQQDSLDARHQLHPIFLFKILVLAAVICAFLTAGSVRNGVIARSLSFYFSLTFLQELGKVSIQAFTFHVCLVSAFMVFAAAVSGDARLVFGIAFLLVFVAFPYLRRIFFAQIDTT